MEENRQQDEFRRIEIIANLERRQQLIDTYAENVKYQHRKVSELQYELGTLDERLGGTQ